VTVAFGKEKEKKKEEKRPTIRSHNHEQHRLTEMMRVWKFIHVKTHIYKGSEHDEAFFISGQRQQGREIAKAVTKSVNQG
jgi:hypothetical protein